MTAFIGRREFIILIARRGGAWSIAAGAQQPDRALGAVSVQLMCPQGIAAQIRS